MRPGFILQILFEFLLCRTISCVWLQQPALENLNDKFRRLVCVVNCELHIARAKFSFLKELHHPHVLSFCSSVAAESDRIGHQDRTTYSLLPFNSNYCMFLLTTTLIIIVLLPTVGDASLEVSIVQPELWAMRWFESFSALITRIQCNGARNCRSWFRDLKWLSDSFRKCLARRISPSGLLLAETIFTRRPDSLR